jgi:hypothetical protein
VVVDVSSVGGVVVVDVSLVDGAVVVVDESSVGGVVCGGVAGDPGAVICCGSVTDGLVCGGKALFDPEVPAPDKPGGAAVPTPWFADGTEEAGGVAAALARFTAEPACGGSAAALT